MAWFVYLVRCRGGSLYCGITKDVAARIVAHNAGTGAKYTRSRGPVTLAWSKRTRGESSARRLEYAIKQMTKLQKEALADSDQRGLSLRGQA
jgi:putative endonuclease